MLIDAENITTLETTPWNDSLIWYKIVQNLLVSIDSGYQTTRYHFRVNQASHIDILFQTSNQIRGEICYNMEYNDSLCT